MQKDQEFKANLGYIEFEASLGYRRLSLKTKTKKANKNRQIHTAGGA